MKFLNILNQSNWQSPKLPAHKAGEVTKLSTLT